MHANSSPNLIILLSPSRDYNMSLCSLYCAYCALKALVGKPTKNRNCVELCTVFKTKSAEIANCLLLWVFAYFADYLRTFASFLRTFCLWFGAFGDQHTAIFTIRRKKLHVFLSLGAGRWDHAWIVGRMSRNDIFCVCICSKKLQNMLVSLIHGTEFIGLTLNVVPQAILITHV